MNILLRVFFRVTGWHNTSLSTRVLLLLALITTGLLGGLLYLAAIGFRHDKLAYIYDLEDLHSETLVTRVRARLDSLLVNGVPFKTSEEPTSLSSLGIPRLPVEGEIFAAQQVSSKILLWRAADGRLMKTDFNNFNPFSDKDGKVYWLTTFGIFMGATPSSNIHFQNFQRRGAVQQFLKSKLKNGLVTLDTDGSGTIASFREIERTNLVVFVETNLSEALAPLKRFLSGAIILGSGVIMLGIILTWMLLSSLWRPVRRVAVMTRDIAQGNYDVDATYGYRDELSEIFSGLGFMAAQLEQREKGLVQLQRNLEQILSTTLMMALADKKIIVVKAAVEAILKTINVKKIANATVEFLPDIQEDGIARKSFIIALDGKLLYRERLIEASEIQVAATSEEDDNFFLPAANSSCYLKGTNVCIPVVSGIKYFAKIEVTAYNDDDLNPSDKVFIDTLAASMAVAFETLLLRDSAAIKVRLETELATAQAVQANLLPSDTKIPSVEIASFYKSSEQTGGDWIGRHFDKITNTVYFYIGDVTGHGVASALLTGVACGAVYASEYTTENHEVNSFGRSIPATVRLNILANVLNRVLVQTGKGNLLMTMAICSLNLNDGSLAYVSAGHTPLFLVKTTDNKCEVVPNSGSILGLAADGEFTVVERKISRGDSLLIYTDGLVENTGPNGETLKLKKVLKSLASMKGNTAQELLDNVMVQANEKWLGAPGGDDVSVMVLRWCEDASSANPIPEPEKGLLPAVSA